MPSWFNRSAFFAMGTKRITVFALCISALAIVCFGGIVKSNIGSRGIGYIEESGIPLPDGVVAVKYLESTGSQWIDTGVIANIKIIVTVDFYHVYDGLNQSQVVVLGRVINGTSYVYQLLARSPNGYKNTLILEAAILLKIMDIGEVLREIML